MARQRIHIGTAPGDEPCAQTGITRDWLRLQQLECLVYRAALIARAGPPPAGVDIKPAHNAHDFGSYHDLIVVFDPDDESGAHYADLVADGLARWHDGGFIAPVAYDDSSQPRANTEMSVADCIIGTIIRLTRLIRDGYGTPADAAAVSHLRQAYPAQAVTADERLAALFGHAGAEP